MEAVFICCHINQHRSSGQGTFSHTMNRHHMYASIRFTLHCTQTQREKRKKESCKESCVKDNLTLSCMLWNEHRCAVSVILLKPENKASSQFLHRYSEDVSFLTFLVHTRMSCCRNTNYEWQDLGPWIQNKLSMLTVGKRHQILWFNIIHF